MVDSIKVQDGISSTKFCGSTRPTPFESTGNELMIGFAVVLTRTNVDGVRDKLTSDGQILHHMKDVTLNKSIEVSDRQVRSCMFCFRIGISILEPSQPISEHSTTTPSPLLVLGTAGAATVLVGKETSKVT